MPFPTSALRAADAYVPTYKSPYAPKYSLQPNVFGLTQKSATKLGLKTGAFGAVALFAVIFYASGIPRIQKDILQKIPFVGNTFTKEIIASDNPF